MSRRFMVGAAALVFALSATAREASAQILGGIGSDPFSFYYGYYLPHAAAVAAQPRAIDSINQAVVARQYTAETDRAALYDPISPYGDEETDNFSTSRRERRAGTLGSGGGGGSSNANGNGPSTYYGRTARYFPSLRVARGPNRNIAAARGFRGGAGAGVPNINPGVFPR